MAKSKSRYQPKPGARISKKAAILVGDALEAMRAADINPTAANLLEMATSRGCALHKLFDWNDASAADRYRLDYAGYLIRSVIEIDLVTLKPGRSFHPIEFETYPAGHFIGRREVIRTPDYLDQVSRRMYADIVSQIAEAESLGLLKWKGWKAIAKAVRSNPM